MLDTKLARACIPIPDASGLTDMDDPDCQAVVEDKVVICHIPPGKPDKAKTISVGAAAVPAHLRHGDTLGPCPE